MSRFQRLIRPLLPPGTCLICGSPEKPVLDFNLNIPRFGRLYFCDECVTEMARVIGYVPATELRMVYPPMNEIKRVAEELTAGLKDAGDTITSLLSAASIDLHNSLVPVVVSEQPAQEPDVNPVAEPETQPSDDGQNAGTVSDEGSDGVSSSSSNEPGSVFEFK